MCWRSETPAEVIDWVRSLQIGRPISAKAISRGRGSKVYRVWLDQPSGAETSVIIRRYTDLGWLEREPDLASREAAMLQFARRAGLPVPDFLGICDTRLPMVAMSALSGNPLPVRKYSPDSIASAASVAVAIHAIEAPEEAGSWPVYSPHYIASSIRIDVPDWTTNPAAWQAAIAAYSRFHPRGTRLLHRDFHMGNLLFQGTKLAGVVDWVTSCFGDPSGDLAHMRWNLTFEIDEEAMLHFMTEYCARTQYVHDRAYDLYAAVGALPDLRTPDRRTAERLDRFVMHALAELGS